MTAAPLHLPTPLVSTEWLAAHLEHPQLRVFDASWYLPSAGRDARAEYAAAHLPDAVFADLDALSDESAPYPHTVPPAEVLAARLGALGVGSEHAVVVYDGSGQHFSAPRLWYMLRTHGHARVAVLNGGLTKWRAEGRPVTTEVPLPVPATFTAQRDDAGWRSLAAMCDIVSGGGARVVDARSASRFTGAEPEPRAGVRSGHMPGATNVHYASLIGADGALLPEPALRARFAAAGVDVNEPVVATCGSGITACAVLLALESLGARDTALYDGSWTEWGSQENTPVNGGS
jgi:thiosulfate/3-mercaptopyruvate sulfurtransferase